MDETLAQFVQHHVKATKYSFTPEISIDSLPTAEEKRYAAKIVEQVESHHESHIVKAVTEAYTEMLSTIPSIARPFLPDDFKNKWMLAKYFTIVDATVKHYNTIDAIALSSQFVFTPMITPDSLDGAEEIAAAKALIARVDQVDTAKIVAAVEDEYSTFISGLPAIARSSLSSDFRNSWTRQEYFKIVRRVVEARTSGASQGSAAFPKVSMASASHSISVALPDAKTFCHPQKTVAYSNVSVASASHSSTMGSLSPPLSAAPTSPKQSTSAVPDMWYSPRKKMKPPAPVAGEGPVRFASVAEFQLTADPFSLSHALECTILYCPEEVKRRAIGSGKAVGRTMVSLSLCVADRTGPITVDFFNEAAERFMTTIQGWRQTNDEPFVITIENFEIKETFQKHKTPCRKLTAIDITKVTMLEQPSREFMCDANIPPEVSLFTRDFGMLTDTAPFIISITGVVQDLRPERATRSGQAIQSFTLHDCLGKYVSVAILGRHAGSPMLVEGNEIILYFLQAKEGLPAYPSGSLWGFDESHIVFLRSNCKVPLQSSEIAIVGPR